MVSRIILQTVILNGIISAFFIIFGIVILNRDKKADKNLVKNKLKALAFFFITFGFSMIINMIYRLIDSYDINLILNKLTIICASFSFIFLISFLTMLRYSEVIFTTKKQIILYISYFLLLCVLIIIPNGVDWEYLNGIGETAFENRDLSDLGDPIYSLAFSLYGIILNLIAISFGLSNVIYMSKQLKGNKQLRRKFTIGMIGVIHFGLLLISAFVAHLMATSLFRSIALIINLIGIPMSFLIWKGFRKQAEIESK